LYTKTPLSLFIICLIVAFPFVIYAQVFDSLSLTVGTQGNIAAKNYQPLWMVSNRFGTIADIQNDLSSFVKITNPNVFPASGDLDEDLLVSNQKFFVNYGFSLFNNNHFKNSFFEQAFLGFLYKKWTIRIGRFEETSGDLDPELSSGSFGISGNSLPIPQINGAILDYIDIPLTNGWVQFKGSLAHGWLGKDRYMKDAFYQGNTFYLRIGAHKLKLYGGLEHYSEWGGERGKVKLDRSFKGFLNVLFVKEADDGSVGTSINGIRPSRAGDERGLLAAGFYWENDVIELHGYAQMPFESGEEIDPRNRSFLAGLEVVNKDEGSVLKKVLLELLYTKDMNYFVPLHQRQSYYNNGYYRTGWEYEDRIIGTPLFINRQRLNKYFPAIPPINWDGPDSSIPPNGNIVDNRIFAIHAGTVLSLTNELTFKSLFTLSVNYGSLSALSKTLFTPQKTQFYTLQSFHYQQKYSKFKWLCEIGYDFGELGSNVGASLGVSYSILN